MHILITGGLGFIGTNLIIKLKSINPSYKITVIDSNIGKSNNKKFLEKKITHHSCDISSNKLFSILSECDLVIHLAARGNVIDSINDPLINFNDNVFSTIKLLESMRKVNLRRIIFASTGGALMGNTPPPVNENSLPRPISPYGASKLACEGYLNAYGNSFDFETIILRFGNVYGRYSLHKKGVINTWIKNIFNEEVIKIFGDGNSSRDYIHVNDITEGIIKSIEYMFSSDKNNSKCNTFHLALANEVTLNKLLEILQKITDKKIITNYYPSRKGEVYKNSASFDSASKTLSFEPKISLEEGLKDLYEWIIDNLD